MSKNNLPRGATIDENFQISVDDLSSDSLTESQLRGLGLDLSEFNNPFLDYELAYLKSILRSDATSSDQWQSDIGSNSTQNAAQWKLGRINDETDNESELTFAMIDAAIGGSYTSSDIATMRGVTIADYRTFWSTGSITATSVTSLKTFVTTSLLVGSNTFPSYQAGDTYLGHSRQS